MAKDPAFLFYPGDYLRDTQTISSNTQVAYDRIMCEHMRNICITQRQLNFFTKRLTEDETEELMFVLSKVKGGFQIEWVAESIEKRRKYSKSRSDNRKGKSKKEDIISETYDTHMENENENIIKKEVENKSSVNKQLIKDVCDFFNVNEFKNFNTYKALHTFVNVSNIDAKTFKAYQEYKQKSREKIHGWQSFIGKPENKFADGAWASCDWGAKIKDIPQDKNGIPSEPDPTWIRMNAKDATLWMEACKIWRAEGWIYKQQPGATVKTWTKPLTT